MGKGSTEEGVSTKPNPKRILTPVGASPYQLEESCSDDNGQGALHLQVAFKDILQVGTKEKRRLNDRAAMWKSHNNHIPNP